MRMILEVFMETVVKTDEILSVFADTSLCDRIWQVLVAVRSWLSSQGVAKQYVLQEHQGKISGIRHHDETDEQPQFRLQVVAKKPLEEPARQQNRIFYDIERQRAALTRSTVIMPACRSATRLASVIRPAMAAAVTRRSVGDVETSDIRPSVDCGWPLAIWNSNPRLPACRQKTASSLAMARPSRCAKIRSVAPLSIATSRWPESSPDLQIAVGRGSSTCLEGHSAGGGLSGHGVQPAFSLIAKIELCRCPEASATSRTGCAGSMPARWTIPTSAKGAVSR